jgi:hypothetical protein
MYKRHVKDNVGITGQLRWSLLEAGSVVQKSDWNSNAVTNVDGQGMNLQARLLVGDENILPKITAAKIGTGTTSPTESDTDLESPTFTTDFIADSGVQGSDQASFSFFIADNEIPNDTYTEFGIFTPPASDRRLFARGLFDEAVDKSSGQDIRVEYDINFS